MEIEILSEKENLLLNRKEVYIRVKYEKEVPKRDEIRAKVIEFLNSDKNLTILSKISPEFGRHSVKGYIKVYKDLESMKVETKPVLEKNLSGKKKKEKIKPEAEEKKEAPEKTEKEKAKSEDKK